jgi:hypothetical protein
MSLLTKHGKERAGERVGLDTKATERMARRVLERGKRPADTAGRLRRYLDSLSIEHGTTPIVYGEHVYCFSGETLVTVLNLPRMYR